jgi:hypothetical protein
VIGQQARGRHENRYLLLAILLVAFLAGCTARGRALSPLLTWVNHLRIFPGYGARRLRVGEAALARNLEHLAAIQSALNELGARASYPPLSVISVNALAIFRRSADVCVRIIAGSVVNASALAQLHPGNLAFESSLAEAVDELRLALIDQPGIS